MLQTEYVRNLNCNYERLLLEKNPEENRYQYCIVTRGGIKGLLPCSLRYINGQAYLYYDISSVQRLTQLYEERRIDRQWVKDFLWGMNRVKNEMERFLLDSRNLLWFPGQIFQELEKQEFFFLYVPYYEGDGGFGEFLDYLVDHMDYRDEQLVNCIYRMHEQYDVSGEIYLKSQIYEDVKMLDSIEERLKEMQSETMEEHNDNIGEYKSGITSEPESSESDRDPESAIRSVTGESPDKESRKGILYFLDGKRRKQKEERTALQERMEELMAGHAVSEEEIAYGNGENTSDREQEEELGRTVFLEKEETAEKEGLYTEEGKLFFLIDGQTVILGKKKDEADCVVDDPSVSRMHARITREKEEIYLEDLNSTNGTFKNGLRMLPYEKRKLDKGDEIRIGKMILFFK